MGFDFVRATFWRKNLRFGFSKKERRFFPNCQSTKKENEKEYNKFEGKNMRKLLTIVISIIGVLDLALLTGLFISLGWAFAFTTLGYSIPTAAALLLISYGIFKLAKKKWVLAYVPSFAVLLLALIFEIIITTFNIFPGLSGLVPTMIVLVGVNGSVIALVTVRILDFVKTKTKK